MVFVFRHFRIFGSAYVRLIDCKFSRPIVVHCGRGALGLTIFIVSKICIPCYCTLLFHSHGLINHTNTSITATDAHRRWQNAPCIRLWTTNLGKEEQIGRTFLSNSKDHFVEHFTSQLDKFDVPSSPPTTYRNPLCTTTPAFRRLNDISATGVHLFVSGL